MWVGQRYKHPPSTAASIAPLLLLLQHWLLRQQLRRLLPLLLLLLPGWWCILLCDVESCINALLVCGPPLLCVFTAEHLRMIDTQCSIMGKVSTILQPAKNTLHCDGRNSACCLPDWDAHLSGSPPLPATAAHAQCKQVDDTPRTAAGPTTAALVAHLLSKAHPLELIPSVRQCL